MPNTVNFNGLKQTQMWRSCNSFAPSHQVIPYTGCIKYPGIFAEIHLYACYRRNLDGICKQLGIAMRGRVTQRLFVIHAIWKWLKRIFKNPAYSEWKLRVMTVNTSILNEWTQSIYSFSLIFVLMMVVAHLCSLYPQPVPEPSATWWGSFCTSTREVEWANMRWQNLLSECTWSVRTVDRCSPIQSQQLQMIWWSFENIALPSSGLENPYALEFSW